MTYKVAILAPFNTQAPGGAQRHLALLTRLLEQHCQCDVTVFDKSMATPMAFSDKLLAKLVPLWSHVTFGKRLSKGPDFKEYDMVFALDLAGPSVRHRCVLWPMMGDYVAFRTYAVARGSGLRGLRYDFISGVYRSLVTLSHMSSIAIPCSEGLATQIEQSGLVKPIDVPTDTEVLCPGSRQEARAALGLDPNGKYLLFSGRLEYAKGLDRLKAIIDKLSSDWKLLLAVPGLTSVPSELQPRVALATQLPPDDMAVMYRAANVCIHPSRFEGAALSVIESFACGVPAISTMTGVGPEIRREPGMEFLVVEEPDVPECWIREILNIEAMSRAEKQALSERVRSYAIRKHSLQAVGNQWNELFSTLKEKGILV